MVNTHRRLWLCVVTRHVISAGRRWHIWSRDDLRTPDCVIMTHGGHNKAWYSACASRAPIVLTARLLLGLSIFIQRQDEIADFVKGFKHRHSYFQVPVAQ